MSTEQSESAPAVTEHSQVDITQQATTPTATTQHTKNPKCVAAGKAVAERTRLAREQLEKAAAEASILIANNKAKATTAAPEPAPTTEGSGEKNSSLSTTHWLAVASLVVSLGRDLLQM